MFTGMRLLPLPVHAIPERGSLLLLPATKLLSRFGVRSGPRALQVWVPDVQETLVSAYSCSAGACLALCPQIPPIEVHHSFVVNFVAGLPSEDQTSCLCHSPLQIHKLPSEAWPATLSTVCPCSFVLPRVASLGLCLHKAFLMQPTPTPAQRPTP